MAFVGVGLVLSCSSLLFAARLPGAAIGWWLIGAPLAEELVFRGGVQAALARRWAGLGRTGTAASVVTASLAFAAVHALVALQPAAALTFWPSLALGALYAHTGRVRDCAALHAAFNACWLGAGAAAPLLHTIP